MRRPLPAATLRVSSRGQVVIPEAVRQRLALKPRTEFVVVGDADVVILKTVAPPGRHEVPKLLARARQHWRACVRPPLPGRSKRLGAHGIFAADVEAGVTGGARA